MDVIFHHYSLSDTVSMVPCTNFPDHVFRFDIIVHLLATYLGNLSSTGEDPFCLHNSLNYSWCCMLRDALLHTTGLNSCFLSICGLSVSLNESGHSPLTSLINKVVLTTELPLTECVLFIAPFSVNSRDCSA